MAMELEGTRRASGAGTEPDVVAAARTLLPALAARAEDADEHDRFVAEGFELLRGSGLLAAGVPEELGGRGATLRELCAMLRTVAHACSSTALAFSMHTHLVATAAWRRRHQGAPTDGLLRRVAADRLVLLSTGGADWLEGSGCLAPVDGGYEVHARKTFVSGAPAGDLLLTSAVLDDPAAGPTIVHFAVPMTVAGVRIEPTWRAHGMRGTGSHDVILDGVFLPPTALTIRRPRGHWDATLHVMASLALPLIYAVYVGIAERARELVVTQLRKRPPAGATLATLGDLEDELHAAHLALADMIAAGEANAPGPATTDRALQGRALAGRAVRAVTDLAMELAGGSAFYRARGLERLHRDAQASRYHPLQDGAQREYAARYALGLDVDPPRAPASEGAPA